MYAAVELLSSAIPRVATKCFSSLHMFSAKREVRSSGYHRREFERLNGLGFVVSNVEDGIQFRDLHQVVNLIREFEQLQLPPLLACCGEAAYQIAQSRAIDVIDFRKIEQDLLMALI